MAFDFGLTLSISRGESVSFCDDYGNCLPAWVAHSIPLISYALNFVLFVIDSLDCIQPDTILEKIEVLTFSLTNFSVRFLSFVLIIAFLGKWTAVLALTVLSYNAFLFRVFDFIPARYNKFSSWLALTNTTLIVEDVSKKERNAAQPKTPKEIKATRRALSILSVSNLIIFSSATLAVTIIIYFDLIFTDINNVLTKQQILPIFLFLFLPVVGHSLLSNLLLQLMPATSPHKSIKIIGAVFNVLIFLSTIIYPILSGIYFIPRSPRNLFLLAKVRDSLPIYSAKSYTDYTWDIQQSWTFDKNNMTLHNTEQNVTFFLQTEGSFSFLRNLSEKELDVLSEAEIFIDHKVSQVNWQQFPFRSVTTLSTSTTSRPKI